MSRFSRINTIWRKELLDTLRDRRTLVAMVLVPIVLYPALMLGSLQAFELQNVRIQHSEFVVAVASAEAGRWLQARIDTDISRQPEGQAAPAEELPTLREQLHAPAPQTQPRTERTVAGSADERAEQAARERPPGDFRVVVVDDVEAAVRSGAADAGLRVDGPLPEYGQAATTRITIIYDQTEFRSYRFAAPGLEGILNRLKDKMLEVRLEQQGLALDFLEPLQIGARSVATPERVGGSILGMIVPFILIVMTISGAIYPAIDLTAGERERGTLETLMVAPVPTVDLIAGKFVVVTLIGLLSATLNLLSVGGTVFLGGLGSILTRGDALVLPYAAIPWVLVVLMPLAVMFSAVLLAVCSFARSFKEAQNYIMPVMVAAMIPAVVGSLPGMQLEGPLLVVPVTNVVLLTRDLFMGRIFGPHILIVCVSSCLYAGAAVAVAAKLFGQEAVLFADSGSVKTLFVRRFFRRRAVPSAAQAFLLLAVVYLGWFLANQALGKLFVADDGQTPAQHGTMLFGAMGLGLVLTFGVLPVLLCLYTKTRPLTALGLAVPSLPGLAAGLCVGLSTWVLASVWMIWQQRVLPIPPEMAEGLAGFGAVLDATPAWVVLFALAVVPGLVEELFFRGYVLNGIRGALGRTAAVAVVAAAFAMNHHSLHRLPVTFMLGLVLGLLVVRTGSVWPAIIAHMLHNGLSLASVKVVALREALLRAGWTGDPAVGLQPPMQYVMVAAALVVLAIVICFSFAPRPWPPKLPGVVAADGAA